MGLTRTSSTFLIIIYLTYQLQLATCSNEKESGTPSPPLPKENPDRALLAFDKVLSGDLVAEKNVTVTYQIYNVGLHKAKDITLRDYSFPQSRFQFLSKHASSKKQWNEILPGESMMYSFIIKPLKSGQLFINLPSLSYVDYRTSAKHVSKIPGNQTIFIEDLLDFKRRTDKHISTWIIYLFLSLLLTIAPFIVSHFIINSLSSISNPNFNNQQPKKSQ